MRAQNKSSRPSPAVSPKGGLGQLLAVSSSARSHPVWVHCSGVLHHALWVFLSPAHTFPSNSFVKFSSERAFCFLLRL